MVHVSILAIMSICRVKLRQTCFHDLDLGNRGRNPYTESNNTRACDWRSHMSFVETHYSLIGENNAFRYLDMIDPGVELCPQCAVLIDLAFIERESQNGKP